VPVRAAGDDPVGLYGVVGKRIPAMHAGACRTVAKGCQQPMLAGMSSLVAASLIAAVAFHGFLHPPPHSQGSGRFLNLYDQYRRVLFRQIRVTLDSIETRRKTLRPARTERPDARRMLMSDALHRQRQAAQHVLNGF
jgi:hypothetical protein